MAYRSSRSARTNRRISHAVGQVQGLINTLNQERFDALTDEESERISWKIQAITSAYHERTGVLLQPKDPVRN